jgi:hypothetical protein
MLYMFVTLLTSHELLRPEVDLGRNIPRRIRDAQPPRYGISIDHRFDEAVDARRAIADGFRVDHIDVFAYLGRKHKGSERMHLINLPGHVPQSLSSSIERFRRAQRL